MNEQEIVDYIFWFHVILMACFIVAFILVYKIGSRLLSLNLTPDERVPLTAVTAVILVILFWAIAYNALQVMKAKIAPSVVVFENFPKSVKKP